MNNEIQLYEELSMNAHPALRTQLYDGWVLRFSNGYTNRANSVNPIYSSSLLTAEKVDVCEDIYTKQGLPTVFKLTDSSPAGLDTYLEDRGYETVTPTYLFTMGRLPSDKTCDNVIVTNGIDHAWREDCFRLNGLTDASKKTTATAMKDNIQSDTLCAKIIDGGQTVACGLCVVERGYAGLYDIVVDASYRQRGYGNELCKALLASASEIGAMAAYLQVVEANAPAVALYKKLGYEYCYTYWYRVKKEVAL